MLQMSGGQINCPIVFRGGNGTAGQLGATHSQSFEAFYAHFPGLKVITPSTPYDAKGLLKAAIRDNDPVIFLESERMYGDKGEIPDGEYIIPIGVADVKRKGTDVTIVSFGKIIKVAFEAAEALEKEGIYTRLMSSLAMDQVCEPYIRRRAIRHLEKGRIVIFGAGVGSPYFTTDSAASLRAIEIQADVVLKGTRVDGVYSADPEKDPTATRFDNLSFAQVLESGYNIMDMTAFTLCQENELPIIVFDMNKKGNLEKVLYGETIGTLIH